MSVKGIIKTSLIDYPNEISSVIFFEGCNLKCRFCHNVELIQINTIPEIPLSQILSFLEKRKKNVPAVVISGGEPTIYKNIIDTIREIKKIGLKVKLDSNGMNPEIIKKICSEKIVDYFAIDIKTSPKKYSEVTGGGNFESVANTIQILNDSNIEYEARTTCVPGIISLEDIGYIGEKIGHLKKYYFQQFRNQITLDPLIKDKTPYPRVVLEKFAEKAKSFSDVCGIRGF